MRKVFILEDDPMRMQMIRELLFDSGLDIDHAESCEQVSKFQPPYAAIMFDHDLGGRQLEEHEDDGFEFANLIRDKINRDAVIIIHSRNPDGAKRIHKLVGGMILPFGSNGWSRVMKSIRWLKKETE